MADEDICPHCGVSRVAPPCPACGKPVSRLKNRCVEPELQAWNSNWDRICAECGHEFETVIRLRSGHTTFFDQQELGLEFSLGRDTSGQSIVGIRGTESRYGNCDYWESVPAVEVRVKRAVAGNAKLDERLPQRASIALTVEEWNTVIEQLQGPLRVLLAQRTWFRDST